MQRSCTLELHSASGRDHIGGIKDGTSFTDGELEVHSHEADGGPWMPRCWGRQEY
jgi:hypothetical protein